MAANEHLPERRFGWSDMFVAAADDPRTDGDWANDERSVLLGSLTDRRLTLDLKCAGLSVEQMARASVPPSDMSLLGIVRHLASVERFWFRRAIAGEDISWPYYQVDGHDAAFDVSAEQAIVDEAWRTWHAEIENSNAVVAAIADLGQLGRGKPVPVREVLVHIVREYAQHLGHADLLRECIDGRVGQ